MLQSDRRILLLGAVFALSQLRDITLQIGKHTV